MKKTGILNAQLSHCIATLGHTEGITVCDAGLPITDSVQRIDLALIKGIPTFLQTLEAVLTEMYVERIVLAEEIKQKNPQILTALLARIERQEREQGNRIKLDYVSHTEFKTYAGEGKAIVRSGECSPYANVILYSGVPF
ncbi:ribose transport protein RbsD [Mesocricetibacter intestinalis]|uniref:D-ribose pyranase n=1 Tax=Mesocricetibacter intestinalis TaxID=1521930 RepID=A0A4R6VCL1_9PAST|nr:D-ribose pyranase [Mesocricetibacter intestinalis]TDQ59664.1 ribose transport protein RbsD [Mesocricetibacter intestinalis]